MDLALQQPHTRVVDIAGQPMKGRVLASPSGIEEDKILAKWLQAATDYVGSLPVK